MYALDYDDADGNDLAWILLTVKADGGTKFMDGYEMK